MNLHEWTVEHVRHQDMLEQSLQGYDETDVGVTFVFEDGEEDYAVQDVFDVVDVDVIVCLNTVENRQRLLDTWGDAVDADVKVIFVNPDANSKWMVRPSVHDRVADPENLEEGLTTLQENTDVVENN